MTLNHFAPDRRYAYDKTPGGPTREFKEMVKAFHDQGIKVLIDVTTTSAKAAPGRRPTRPPATDGTVPDAAYFNGANNHALAWRIDGSELGDSASAIYVAHNAWRAQVNFTLPWPGAGKSWYRVTDTCGWAEGAGQGRAPGAEDLLGGENTVYGVCGRGTLLLIAK
ncbi:MAG: glycogen debranching enzyme [Massilia sp.]|nr:glycogen debranching enzyme [Massilia sp.]